MRHLFIMALAVGCILAFGCAKQHTTAQWRQRASAIQVGTPKEKVEEILPPAGTVLDLRSSGNSPGPVAYRVDNATVVKLWYDGHNRLGRPIVVEHKKGSEANKTSGGDAQ